MEFESATPRSNFNIFDRKKHSNKLKCIKQFYQFVVYPENFPYSDNKGADQLCGYREADLRLCFRIFKKPVFS